MNEFNFRMLLGRNFSIKALDFPIILVVKFFVPFIPSISDVPDKTQAWFVLLGGACRMTGVLFQAMLHTLLTLFVLTTFLGTHGDR